MPPPTLNPASACTGPIARADKSSGFTLIEMVVVVAVVLVILGLVLPAASTLWGQRKMAQAENAIQGLLMTSRVKAMQADGVETGFLAFVDREGNQHLVTIEQHRDNMHHPAWQNVFVITDDPDQILPTPIRAVPLYVVYEPGKDEDREDWEEFSGRELANNDFYDPAGNQTQRHRNFFTLVFSTDGQMLKARDVLIQDADANRDELGDRTGLRVGPGGSDPPTTVKFYPRDDDEPKEIDPTGNATPIPFLVTDNKKDVAVNFPAVDGLLVYDDSLFNELTVPEKRSFVLHRGHPLYVNRWTGAVIRGPVGETEVHE